MIYRCSKCNRFIAILKNGEIKKAICKEIILNKNNVKITCYKCKTINNITDKLAI